VTASRRACTSLAVALALSWLGCIEKTRLPADDDDTSVADDDDDDITPTGLAIQGTLPDAALFEFYSAWVQPGEAVQEPLYWEIISGELPGGVVMETDGWVHGYPEEEGTFEVEVRLVEGGGGVGTGPVELAVAVDPDHLYAGIWFEQVDPLCEDLGFLCFPWVRVVDAGEPQSERTLHPALFHVGLDGEAQDGFGDDILYQLVDPAAVTWAWTPLEWPTGDGTTLVPDDAVITADGTMTAGELTGGGVVSFDNPALGHGEATAYVVPPDWCPGWGC